MKKTKILIEVRGGIIQHITSNDETLDVVVVDYDSEDWTDDPEGNETVEGSAWMRTESSPDQIADPIFKTFEKHKGSQEKYVYEKLKGLGF